MAVAFQAIKQLASSVNADDTAASDYWYDSVNVAFASALPPLA